MMAGSLSLSCLLAASLAACLLPSPTAAVDPSISVDLLWPMPDSVVVSEKVLYLDPATFKFTAAGANAASDTLNQAISRYTDLIFKTPIPFYPSASGVNATSARSGLTVSVSSTDEALGLNTDESCKAVCGLCSLSVLRPAKMSVYKLFSTV